MSSSPASAAAIAFNRFGIGARPSDAPPDNPHRTLLEQFSNFDVAPAGLAALPDAGAMVKAYQIEQRELRSEAAQAKAMSMTVAQTTGQTIAAPAAELKADRKDFGQQVQALYRQAVQARAQSAIDTDAPFVERMVHFWSNHFCISADNPQTTAFAGAFERDAIRPHVLGRFEDMLLAVEQHPAMLVYLNQIQSIGPNSPAALRIRSRNPTRLVGLNENLGRETMELHTLGVRSGYTQADVTDFSRALTGWTVDGLGAQAKVDDGDLDRFLFRPELHEPGSRTIRGVSYPQSGEDQARAVLVDLARAPQTATHVATKLARHFAGDTPPPALVARLATSFARSRGDLPTVYRTLIASDEPWMPQPTKFKTPWEWTISALRGLGTTDLTSLQLANLETQLGQPVWKPGSPAGWDDTAASWAAPNALLRRVEVAQRLAAVAAGRLDARTIAPRLIPASLNPATADQINRAESPASALALLLVSPDFLRR